MELIDNFVEESWKKGNYELEKGFKDYRIIRSFTKDGFFEYAIFDNDGGMNTVQLYGSSSKTYDPLHGLNNVKLFLDGQMVIGVIAEDECVLKKGSKAEESQDQESASSNISEAQTNGEDNKEDTKNEEEEERNLSVKGVPHCGTCTCTC